jgi:hypothetical protein
MSNLADAVQNTVRFGDKFWNVTQFIEDGKYTNTKSELAGDYDMEQQRLYDIFEEDLAIAGGVTDNPKRNLLFRKVLNTAATTVDYPQYLNWDILFWYKELVDLIK